MPINTESLAVLADVGIKSVLILAVTGATVLAIRRASASTKHTVWFLGVLGVLVLPVLGLVLPGWHVLPTWTRSTDIVEPITTIESSPVKDVGLTQSTFTSLSPAPESARRASSIVELSSRRSPMAMSTSRQGIDWPTTFLVTWLLGASVVFLPVVLGRLSLFRIGRQATEVYEEKWMSLLERCRATMKVSDSVRLIRSERRSMPLTWTSGFPLPSMRFSTIMLPKDADEWPVERRRIVLLHELAHIKRCDCLTQQITQIACALYWFNPLIWLVFKRMQVEREQACDDMVLAVGAKPSDYAEHLLHIASELRSQLFVSYSAIAMARKSKLECRVRAILDATRNRRTVTRRLLLLSVALVLCVLAPIAMLRAADAGSEYRKSLKNGVTVELIGIAYSPSRDQAWWRPDGSGIESAPYEWIFGGSGVEPNQSQYEIAFRLFDLPEDKYFTRIEIGDESQGHIGTIPNSESTLHSDMRVRSVVLPASQASTSVRFGVAANNWRTLHTFSGPGLYDDGELPIEVVPLSEQQTDGMKRQLARIGASVEGYREGALVVKHPRVEPATRVVVIDQLGETHSLRNGRSIGRDGVRINLFPLGINPDQVKEYRFQISDYEWAEFDDVSLQPDREAQEFASMRRRQRLSKPADQAELQQAREHIFVLRNLVVGSRTDEWAGAIKSLAEIGSPAVPELVVELKRTDRPYTQSAIAFALRAIGDPRAVPALIDALGESLWAGSDFGGASVKDKDVQSFMMRFQGSRSLPGSWNFGRPVNEITHALVELTGHSEGFDASRAYDETGERITGTYEKTEAVKASTRNIRRQVAERWREWWDAHKSDFVTLDQMTEFDTAVKAIDQLRETQDSIASAGVDRFGHMFPGGSNVEFGPVVEMTVPLSGMEDRKVWVDFESGKRFARPKDLSDGITLRDWRRDNNIDAWSLISMSTTKFKNIGLHGGDTYVWKINNDRWGSIDDEIRQVDHITVEKPAGRFSTPIDGGIPATFLFRTREGGLGVLQITGFSDGSDGSDGTGGTQIRYKLVEEIPSEIAPAIR